MPRAGAKTKLPWQVDLGTALGQSLLASNKAGDLKNFLEWSKLVPEPKTGTLDFHRFPYQVEMYRVFGDRNMLNVMAMKGTQVGASALLVRNALFGSDQYGWTCMYVFPTLDDVYDFADARVTPMIENSDYLGSKLGDPDNKGLKKIGPGLVYFRGSGSERKLDSVDADALFFDEYDTLEQRNIPHAERRLSGLLSAGVSRRVGVPSIPDFGISKRFDQSDQRRWTVRCERCGVWQPLEFFENVDKERALLVCREPMCREPLRVQGGEWVAKFPDRAEPGFHIHRLIVPSVNLGPMIEASRSKNPFERQVFWNKDLGLPYAERDGRLTKDMVEACQRSFLMVDAYRGDNPVTMGVDCASRRNLNVRVSEWLSDTEKRCLWVGEVGDGDGTDPFVTVSRMMEDFNVNFCCFDHEPEGRLAAEIASRYPGRVHLVALSGTAKQVISVKWEERRTTVNRSRAIEEMWEGVRKQRNLLPAVLPQGYVDQMTSLSRRLEKNELDEITVQFLPTGDADYAFAEIFDNLAYHHLWMRLYEAEMLAEETASLDDLAAVSRSDVADLENAEYALGPGVTEAGGFWGGDDL